MPGDAATPVLPDFTSQTATVYKTNIDAGFAVLDRLSWAFAPHEQTVPVMTVRLEAGALFDGTTLTEVAAQSTGTITAPSVNPRIDRVVIDRATGVVSVITGSEDPSPSAPAITTGDVPVCQVALIVSQSTITNTDITDERNLALLGAHGLAGAGLDSDADENIRVNALHERKTANYTALVADRGRLLEFDSGSAISLFLTAAATLTEGWFVYVNNSGAGQLTIDPNGAELIDDATTITLDQNQSAIVFCDSAAFWTVGKPASSGGALKSVQVFTSTGGNTWTKPAGINAVRVQVQAGGGGGGTGTANETASGGGGGGYTEELILSGLGTTETATVGAGATAGNTGGSSSFGSFCSATGGVGGAGTSAVDAGGAGGIGSDGSFNAKGGGGMNSSSSTGDGWGAGGDAVLGGGAPGNVISAVGLAGGVYGGGGGGAGGVNAGGTGGNGIVIVWEYS